MRGSAGGGQQHVDALAQPRTQNRVIEICRGFRWTLDRVMDRCRTKAQAVELREDVPHPVGSLLSDRDLVQGRLIIPFLGIYEALQVVGVGHLRCLIGNLGKVYLSGVFFGETELSILSPELEKLIR